MRESDERIGFHWYLQDSGKPERWNSNIASFARIGVFNHDNTASSDAGFRSGLSCRTEPQFLWRMLRALAAASLDLNQGRKCPCGMKIFNDNQRMRSMMAKGSIIARDHDTLAAPADIQVSLGLSMRQNCSTLWRCDAGPPPMTRSFSGGVAASAMLVACRVSAAVVRASRESAQHQRRTRRDDRMLA